jgi:hypothetical protein
MIYRHWTTKTSEEPVSGGSSTPKATAPFGVLPADIRMATFELVGELGGLGSNVIDNLEHGRGPFERGSGLTFHEFRWKLLFFLGLAWYAARIAVDASTVVLQVLAELGGRPAGGIDKNSDCEDMGELTEPQGDNGGEPEWIVVSSCGC